MKVEGREMVPGGLKTYSKQQSMYCVHEEKEPVIIRLKTKSKPCEKVQGSSKSSISNLTFGGMLERDRVS
jgi:hypothetical protein